MLVEKAAWRARKLYAFVAFDSRCGFVCYFFTRVRTLVFKRAKKSSSEVVRMCETCEAGICVSLLDHDVLADMSALFAGRSPLDVLARSLFMHCRRRLLL